MAEVETPLFRPPSPPDRHYPLVYPPTPPPEAKPKRKVKKWKPKGKFQFFSLPAELRAIILDYALTPEYPENQYVPDRPLDLDPSNIYHVAPLLDLFLVCRRMHEEAYPIFYRKHAFQLFPMNGKFFNARQVLLERLPPHYQEQITRLQLSLGRGWSRPPKTWHMLADYEDMDLRYSKKVGIVKALKQCTALKTLDIFVECDPSDKIFSGFRVNEGWYTEFAERIISEIFDLLPNLEAVRFDGYPSVKLSGQLMQMLVEAADSENKRILWGPQRGWAKEIREAQQQQQSGRPMNAEIQELYARLETLNIGSPEPSRGAM